MTKNVVVIGTQWGDEGKGKVVDWLTDHALITDDIRERVCAGRARNTGC